MSETGRATFVYVGTQTGPGKAEGIGVFRLDDEDGTLSHVQTVGGEHNPTFLAVSPEGRTLYDVTRAPQGSDGALGAFSVDAASGRLTALNRQSSHGRGPAYVSVHPSGRFVFAANFGSGHVASYPVEADGRLGAAASVHQHEGRSSHPKRQEGPHAHFITCDPTGRYALSCDLGIDRVMVYRVDQASGRLEPNDPPSAQISSGAGPRHLAFHSSGKFVYVINEIDSTMSAFTWDGERGALQIVDTRSTLPDDYRGDNSCAQVVVHPNGRFVYGSNRGHDSIAIFGIDQETGRLRPLGHVSTQGKIPRNFNIHPDGKLLLAANQDSNTIVAFRIDEESGALTPTGRVTQTPAPVCIQFRIA